MNFFNYYAAWDSDTSATEERGGGGLWGSAATAAWELFSIFPFVLSFPLVFFFFYSPNLSVQMKQQKVRVWSN